MRVCLRLTTVLAFVPCAFAEPPLENRLQGILDEVIGGRAARGVSAAVVSRGTEWTGVSGMSHGSVPIEPDMLFAIGSITKNCVAALTLKLVEEGKLSLDDPLSKWLPDYPHVDPAITLRQLLNHTSGLHMVLGNQAIWDELKRDRARVWAPEDVLAYIQEPYFPPGGGWRYSNTGYLLLAMIIEEATGSTLSAELRSHLWDPLGIQDVYLSIQEEIPDNVAHVWGDNFDNDGSDRDITFLPRASHDSIGFGSAGLFMTAQGLVRWCDGLFQGRVLSPESMGQMLDFVERGFWPRREGYGLGVQLFRRRLASGERAMGHGGGNIGTIAYMVHVPEHEVSVAVMVNSFDSASAQAATRGLIAAVLRSEGAIGPLPYSDLWPLAILAFCVFAGVTLARVVRKRRGRPRR